jgi:hypothetical protein
MPGVISAGIATGPRYAGVDVESEKLRTVDQPGAAARKSDAQIKAEKELGKEIRFLPSTKEYQDATKGKTKEEKAAIRKRFEQEIKNKPAYSILKEGAPAAPAPAAPAAKPALKWDQQTQSWK